MMFAGSALYFGRGGPSALATEPFGVRDLWRADCCEPWRAVTWPLALATATAADTGAGAGLAVSWPLAAAPPGVEDVAMNARCFGVAVRRVANWAGWMPGISVLLAHPTAEVASLRAAADLIAWATRSSLSDNCPVLVRAFKTSRRITAWRARRRALTPVSRCTAWSN